MHNNNTNILYTQKNQNNGGLEMNVFIEGCIQVKYLFDVGLKLKEFKSFWMEIYVRMDLVFLIDVHSIVCSSVT